MVQGHLKRFECCLLILRQRWLSEGTAVAVEENWADVQVSEQWWVWGGALWALSIPAQSSTWKHPLNSTSFFPVMTVTTVSPAGKAPTASLLPATPPPCRHTCALSVRSSLPAGETTTSFQGVEEKGNRYTEQALLLLDLQQVLSGSVRVTLCPGSWSSSSSVTPDEQVTERVLCDMCDVQNAVCPVAFGYLPCLQS